MQGKSEYLQKSAVSVDVGTPIILNGAFASIAVQVWGTFVGTVGFEVTLNGVDWVPASGQINSTTVPGVFYFTVNGVMRFRSNITAYTSGSINAIANSLEESMGDSGTTSLTGRNAVDAQALWTPGMLYNGTTNDMPRGNTQGTLLASAARTANVSSPIITNYNSRGVIITVIVTAVSGTTPALTLQITDANGVVGYAPISSPTITVAGGTYKYVLYPSTLTAPNNSIGIAQLPLGRLWQVFFAITGTTPSFTFSANYELVL